MIEFGNKSLDLSEGLFEASLSSPLAPKTSDSLDLSNYKESFKNLPILYWGPQNDYPQLLDDLERKSGVMEAGLQLSGDYLIGQGIYLYVDKLDETTQEVVQQQIVDPEITDDLEAVGYEAYRQAASREYLKWGNAWPIYKMDQSRKIVQLKIFDSPFCRLERPHPVTTEIENLYVSAQWQNMDFTKNADLYSKQLGKWMKKYKLLKPFNVIAQMQAQPKIFDFAQHIKMHTSGAYYGRAPWHAVFESGWLDISVSVPQMKRRLFKNSMTLNYHIKIHEDYWKEKYGADTWTDFTPEEKMDKIKAKQKELEDNVIGENKSYKTLFSAFKTDVNGKQIYSIEIEMVDNKLKEGTHIPDAQIADAQIVFALLVDPSLFGMSAPGSSNQTGSGSNIREASLALQARLNPHRDLINQPFYVLAEQRGWKKKYPGLKIGTKGYIINTLDQRAPAASQTTKQK